MRVRVHYACCECGSPMRAVAPRQRPDPPFCDLCRDQPGWFRSLARRLRIDPRHPGTEPQLATVPAWEPAR